MQSKRPKARASLRPIRNTSHVVLENGALYLDGRAVPFFSGALHYYRLNPSDWRAALQSLKDMGLTVVETYVPWQVHELSPGAFDFGSNQNPTASGSASPTALGSASPTALGSADHDPQKDLRRFLEMAQELGLYVFLRPGPHINAEMTYFGLPERIVYDRACQARSPRQNPVYQGFPPRMFPAPSYGSEVFSQEVIRFYQAFAAAVAPFVYPAGPLVMLQVDNEGAYYFRDAAFDQDYHPDTLAKYRVWLADRYGAESSLSVAHGRVYERFENVVAPTTFEARGAKDLPLHLDWLKFKESLLVSTFHRWKTVLEQSGLADCLFVHNLSLGELSASTNLPELETALDVVGADFYHPRRELRLVKRRALYLSGSSSWAFAPELGAGAPFWFSPLSSEDSIHTALASFAYGIRGFNLYMAVDRDRWYGSPIDSSGVQRASSGAWKHWIDVLHRVKFWSLQREAKVGIVIPREYARLARASHCFGLFSGLAMEAIGGTPVDGASDEAFGFTGPIQILYWRSVARWMEALSSFDIPYVLIDGDVAPERYAGLDLLFSPSFEFANEVRWQNMCAFAESGGRVIVGPATPVFDETMELRDFDMPEGIEHVIIDTLDEAKGVVRTLLGEMNLQNEVRVYPKPLEVSQHVSKLAGQNIEGDIERLAFVMNPTKFPQNAVLSLTSSDAQTEEWEDAQTGEVFVFAANKTRLSMVPASLTRSTFPSARAPQLRADARSDARNDARSDARSEARTDAQGHGLTAEVAISPYSVRVFFVRKQGWEAQEMEGVS